MFVLLKNVSVFSRRQRYMRREADPIRWGISHSAKRQPPKTAYANHHPPSDPRLRDTLCFLSFYKNNESSDSAALRRDIESYRHQNRQHEASRMDSWRRVLHAAPRILRRRRQTAMMVVVVQRPRLSLRRLRWSEWALDALAPRWEQHWR